MHIDLSAAEGVEIVKVMVTVGETEVTMLSDNSFYMPMGDVTVAAVAKLKTYTVVFKSDGVTILSLKLKHGEKITPPANPKKENDGVYSYEFERWSKDAATAESDLEINAIYKKTVLPAKERPGGIVLSKSVWRIVIICTVAAVAVLAVLLTGVILTVKLTRHRRNVKNAQNTGR